MLGIQEFVVHFYNFYFAHTAGGRTIGKRVMGELFGGHLFAFYSWDRDVQELLAGAHRGVQRDRGRNTRRLALRSSRDEVVARVLGPLGWRVPGLWRA
mmetsp:Transcript_77064/g.208086  ORF Transcript_77064/g.208086 Transcript_77064/m.208086 type:complete len:98 (+) Transcript_77064:546-839(+)